MDSLPEDCRIAFLQSQGHPSNLRSAVDAYLYPDGSVAPAGFQMETALDKDPKLKVGRGSYYHYRVMTRYLTG